MINLSSVASSLARAALSDSPKPKLDLVLNVASHIAGKVALQLNQSLLEQKGNLTERQQKGLSVILDALSGKEPVINVETYARGGAFKLARAAYDVASVVWERDTKRPEVMSFLSFMDHTGKSLFSLGKKLADALAAPLAEPHKDNTVAANLRNAFFASKLYMSKVMQDIADQIPEETQPSSAGSAPPPASRPDSSERPQRQDERPRRPSRTPPPPPRTESGAGPKRPSAPRPEAKTAADASAKVGEDRPAKPVVKPLYQHLGLTDMTADMSAIRKAYRDSALKHHPDKHPGNQAEATERFKSISNAYTILSDPEMRKAYDSGRINEQGENI
ncbi:J domain-containing protein [Pseudomonas sp. CDFA 602]|uniref:J domain-containing protein n=1 Tax=Pseudomonas californiensis TaxID=2829823 RepID=UPI001E5CD00E|nr:J domain-containing protein [Pseudomonas californiensis]MCD5995268.1 J domain-containing protein [Pseudomonas californiensis]MCD6000901.1 J domain-containing protein [Pseudomonas californiensis]